MSLTIDDKPAAGAAPAMSPRKSRIRDLYERLAPARGEWLARNEYYYADDRAYMRFLVPEKLRVLELGCGNGQLLASLAPSYGLGIDISPAMVGEARKLHPGLNFLVGDIEDPGFLETINEKFDVIILSDTIGYLEDCQTALSHLHRFCLPETRLIVSYYSKIWEPVLKLGEWLGLKMPTVEMNWLSSEDMSNLLMLTDFEPIKREWRQLVPKRWLGLGPLINRYIGTLPVIRRMCLRDYVAARSLITARDGNRSNPSVTVLIPCRNEAGNIEPAIKRVPRFAKEMEYLFVEGHSSDNTVDEIKRVIASYPELDIRLIQQDGKGKGNAVRNGFDAAKGEVMMILDADLTMPPEDLPKFYAAIASGKGEFINGSRLVYPMENEAMRFLNHVANWTFSKLFSWLLNQRFTDTLCGTKVLYKTDYERIAANRSYFGEFDPFGDFDLLFGAAKLNLKIVEVPIRYAARTYGTTQISRFTDGWLLLRMVAVAYRRLKAF
ncbi:glycosyltransferase [Rhodoplanes sp. Z2-YC6860]|uniref:glycosyltransferase n=1 Tax=Rhodoplanes sp. Z2-YC6860 TaxID=674703 RepID=UPI00078BF7A0|nr:glycosyltransferase [Rhodoplanes sp. Z2-YC6860]AMN43435.1 type 12 methyltransferase [Rhodoplanes sp. Z2-YC6860]